MFGKRAVAHYDRVQVIDGGDVVGREAAAAERGVRERAIECKGNAGGLGVRRYDQTKADGGREQGGVQGHGGSSVIFVVSCVISRGEYSDQDPEINLFDFFSYILLAKNSSRIDFFQ